MSVGLIVLPILAFLLYLWSFGFFKRYLAIKDTPTSKVAALSPGLCEVYGEAEIDKPFVLFDRTQCIAYSLRAGAGKLKYEEEGLAPFYIKDETGRVLIDPSALAKDSLLSQMSTLKRYSLSEKDPLYAEAKKFLDDHGGNGFFAKHMILRMIPLGTKVHVIGDYSTGKVEHPKLRQDGEPEQAGFLKFFRGSFGATKVLYQKELPQADVPHIGLGKSKVFNVSSFEEKKVLGIMYWSVVFGFIIAPIVLAGCAALLLTERGASAFALPLYLLLMAYPSYLYFASFYNSLAILRNNSEKYLSNVDVYLDRRAELVPKLKQVVQGYAKHEKKLMEKIAGRNLTDKEFIAVAEAMPEIKADAHYRKLASSISETETQVASFRTLYNDGVTLYNTRLATFPAVLFAGLLGFKKMELLEF